MKKKLILTLMTALLIVQYLPADEKQDLWLKAAAEKDLQMRLQYFEEFLQTYGEGRGKQAHYLFYNLAETAFRLQQYDKSIQYGQKALEYEDLEANLKLQTYMFLANAFKVTKTDLDKAYNYAGLVIDFGTQLKENSQQTQHSAELNKTINLNFIAPAYRIQMQILYEKGKNDPAKMVEACEKAMEAYQYNPDERNINSILSLAYQLSKKDRLDEAISFVEKICVDKRGDAKCYSMLGAWYHRKGDKDRAINYFEKYYEAQEKDDEAGKTALNIGKLLYKKDKDKALAYFAEAFLLTGSDKESNAYKYLQQLWFNEIAKEKTQEEQDQGLQQILSEAKTRLGMSSTQQ